MPTTQSLRADWIAIAVGAGALALIMSALAYQYLGAMPPCQMCHWQRWPHIAAAVVGVIGGGFLPRRFAFPIATAAILLVLTSGVADRLPMGRPSRPHHLLWRALRAGQRHDARAVLQPVVAGLPGTDAGLLECFLLIGAGRYRRLSAGKDRP
jgi:disulfide bond formation protein DsbB